MKLKHFFNRFLLTWDYYKHNVVTRGFPAHLKVELTNHCNLACPMCPRSKMSRSVGFMDLAIYERIVNFASSHNCEFMYLHFLGESLFHPNVAYMVRLAHDFGMRVGLSTNGTRMDRGLASELLKANLDLLIISVDSPTKRIYERLRSGASFDEVVRNVYTFARMISESNSTLTLVVQMTYCDSTADECQDFVRMWKDIELGPDRFRLMIKQWDDWAGQMSEIRTWNPTTQPVVARSEAPCALLWRELSIQWEGTVVPCSRVFDRQITLGNLASAELADLWNGERMRQLRLAHVNGTTENTAVCNSCVGQRMRPARFLMYDQFAARLRHYGLSLDGTPKMGLS